MKNCNCCTTYNAPDLMDGGVMAAARAEAEGKFPPPRESAVIYPLSAVRSHSRGAFLAGAEWARNHLAAQEPTDAEIRAVMQVARTHYSMPLGVGPSFARAVLDAARAVGRDAR